MSFLNPIWLWGVLAAAGVATPIVVHLLNRRRGAEVEWAAMGLLRRAMEERSRRVRLEDRLLLVLRSGALLLIAGAMARPTLHGSTTGWLGGPRRTGIVIGVDTSYSMAYHEVRSRLDAAREAAAAIASGLSRGEPISVVAMGGEPTVLLDRAEYSEARLTKALAGLSPSPGPMDLAAGLGRLSALLKQTAADVKQCYLISDGQGRSWSRLSPSARSAMRELTDMGPVGFAAVGPAAGANLAIERLELASGSLRRGTTARCVATIVNGGVGTIDGAMVTLYADGEPVERTSVGPIPEGQTAEAQLTFRTGEPGAMVLEARLMPDNLPIDDARWLVAMVRPAIDVLVVDGDPSPQRYQSESAFLTAALEPTPATPAAASLRVERIAADQWAERRDALERFEVIITANVGRIEPALVERLKRWVRGGGAMLIFPGDQVTASVFNRQFAAGRSGLSPARLSGVVAEGGGAPGRRIELADRRHRLGRLLAGLPEDVANATRLRRYFRLDPVEGARTIWRVGEAGHAALVEHRFGRGRVMLFASTADRDWTDVPVLPVFPMMLHEAVTHLTSPVHEGAFTVGQPIRVGFDEPAAGSRVRVRRPMGVMDEAAVVDEDGRAIAVYEGADEPGVYRFAPIGNVGMERGTPAAVNVDASESRLDGLGPASLSVALGEGVTVIDAGSWREAVSEVRAEFELWPGLMGAGLLMLLIEQWLANRFGRAIDRGKEDRRARGRGAGTRPARRTAA